MRLKIESKTDQSENRTNPMRFYLRILKSCTTTLRISLNYFIIYAFRILTNLYRWIDEFGFSGSERRRQPERLQTCYENYNAVRITYAFLGIIKSIN